MKLKITKSLGAWELGSLGAWELGSFHYIRKEYGGFNGFANVLGKGEIKMDGRWWWSQKSSTALGRSEK